MLSTYPALFFKEKDGSYSVVFPDLNHLSTDGRDMKEATEMAVDCLAGYLYMAKMDGDDVPPPTTLDEIDPHCEDFDDDDYESVSVQYVPVDVEAYAESNFEKKVKKSVTIPKWVDEKAKSLGINFSEVLELSLKSVFKGTEANLSCANAAKLMPLSPIGILGAIACVLPSSQKPSSKEEIVAEHVAKEIEKNLKRKK